MGFKQIRTSDLTGKELDDAQVVTVLVREAGKLFDASAEELKDLKPVANVMELEYRHADGRTESVLVNKAEFAKVVPAEVLERADSIRGRRSGFSPRNGNGG